MVEVKETFHFLVDFEYTLHGGDEMLCYYTKASSFAWKCKVRAIEIVFRRINERFSELNRRKHNISRETFTLRHFRLLS